MMSVSFQVDESLLSDGGRDERGGGGGGGHGHGRQAAPPPSSSLQQQQQQQQQQSRLISQPWVQMALPGGGIVSVPLESTATRQAGGAGGIERVTSPSSSIDSAGGGGGGGGQLLQGLPPPPPPASASASGDASSVGGASDLLQTAPASAGPGGGGGGEPVTHFNLDQLLEIVQSFQLDATLAGNEEAAHLNLASAEGAVASIIKVRSEAVGEVDKARHKGICERGYCSRWILGQELKGRHGHEKHVVVGGLIASPIPEAACPLKEPTATHRSLWYLRKVSLRRIAASNRHAAVGRGVDRAADANML